MIRPITVICWVLALGAGLYLYRAKHEVELMDKRIAQIARETDALRAESRHMLDEWIRLGEPEQLHKYSDQYLGLKTVAPTQFVRVSDLAGRLPPPLVLPEGQVETLAVPRPGAMGGRNGAADAGTDETDLDELPVPPVPPSALASSSPVPATAKPAAMAVNQPEPSMPRPRVAEETRSPPPKPVALRASDSRPPLPVQTGGLPPLQAQGQGIGGSPPAATGQTPVQAAASGAADLRMVRSDARGAVQPPSGQPPSGQPPSGQPPAGQQRAPARVQAQSQPRAVGGAPGEGAPAAGSLLGMSRGPVPLPLPAPTPVSATWNGANGSGR